MKLPQCLWEREVFVDIEHGINTAIRKIRQILGDSPDLPQFVQTISGSGYRFIAPVTAVEPEVTEPTPLPGIGPICLLLRRRSLLRPSPAGCQTSITDSGWSLTLCAFVLVAISILTLGPHPLAARFLDRADTLRNRLARRSASRTISPAIRIRSTSPTA